MNGNQRRAILVLGMHRSGTSAVSRVVNLLGAATPATLLQPAADNPTGFWESSIVAGTNERMLKAIGADTFDCLTFDAVAIGGQPLVPILTAVLQAEYGAAELVVIKDPRLSVTLSLWLPTFAKLRMQLSALIVLRNPVEVAHSLQRRESLTTEVSVTHWLRHLLDAERQTRTLPRSVVSYGDFLADWRKCMERAGREAAIAWPNDSARITAQVDAFLRADLRHHHSPLERPQGVAQHAWEWVVHTYETFEEAARAGWSEQQLRRLDRIRGEFDAWCQSRPFLA